MLLGECVVYMYVNVTLHVCVFNICVLRYIYICVYVYTSALVTELILSQQYRPSLNGNTAPQFTQCLHLYHGVIKYIFIYR